MSKMEITNALRSQITEDLINFLSEKYDCDVCRTAAGTVMIPTVDSEGEDRWVKFSVIIPKDAAEENGNDGYSLARDYEIKQDEKAAKKAAREKKSAARRAGEAT